MTTATAVPDVLPRAVHRGDPFHVRMAAVSVAVAVIGFAPTYWLPLFRGTLDASPLTHLHALFFYGWVLFFLAQARLVQTGRVARHREMGVFGVALATGLVFVGLATAVHSIRRFEEFGFGERVRAFSVVPVTGMALFVALFAVAIVNVRRPDVHKRLLLVATVSMLQAGIGRWFGLFLAPPRPEGYTGPMPPPPIPATVGSALAADLLIVAAMIHDRRTRGSVHPAYWAAGAALLFVQLVRVPLGPSAAWTRVTHWLVALAP